MSTRIVEIAQDGRHLSVKRGFLVVLADGAELGRVALDDVGAVIANAHGLTYSNALLMALADRTVPMVLCGPNHSPVSILWPVVGHHAQTRRMGAQIDAGKPLHKRLWQGLVKAKIANQAAALAATGQPSGALTAMVGRVRSGDPDNLEAQAAQRYWRLLMGPDFRRDADAPGVNGLLNYGYAILRSAVARSVLAAGLHPTLGLFHGNQYNPMGLVDDLMEPFRPIVDLAVVRLRDGGTVEVDADAKHRLAGLLALDMHTAAGTTPLSTCAHRLAASVARSFEEGKPSLDLPLSPLPLEFGFARGGGGG